MQLIYQIPRNSLAWLLAAYLAVIAPHVMRLPIWIVLAAVWCLLWRIQVYRGVWNFPRRWIKYLLAGISLVGLLAGYGRLAGLEPMVALLIIGFSMKLLEMYQRRDAVLVIYLAYIIAATQLLFAQTISSALYMVFSVVLMTTALMSLNQSQGFLYPRRSLILTGKLLLQSIPLMLLLFIVMPRLGALWSVPLQQHAAKTGVSDSMSPGDFSQLAKSAELAFRVSFKGAIPSASERYWRGLVFSRFDGRSWTQAEPFDYYPDGKVTRWFGERSLAWEELIDRRARAITYEVILEPTQQTWLYALMVPQPDSANVGITRDFRIVNRMSISNRLAYRVSSHLDYQTEYQSLPSRRYRNETQLPTGFNPRSARLAKRWRAESGTVEAYIQRVLNWFNREFTYTVQPPLLGKDTVDEFLFESQRGFCEHFASSFTIMMRAAGIPARIVVGYQGGEINPLQNYMLVHQFDAHAWTEVWLEGKGWRRIDPTAAVAPERIENGFSSMVDRTEFLSDSPLSLVRYQNIRWLNMLRLQLDRLDYAWYSWVLGFDNEIQADIFKRLFGSAKPIRIALALIILGGLVLGAIAISLLMPSRSESNSQSGKAYRRFCRRLSQKGLVRKPYEPPSVFAARVAKTRPDLASAVAEITQLFQDIHYAGAEQDEKRLVKMVNRFKPRRRV